MIPSNIKKEHILEALRHIALNGVPSRRESSKYILVHEGKAYPPKYTISLAYKVIIGEELNSNFFNGGKETNRFLQRLGFEIEERS